MNERIRKFMESQGLTPSELADNIGVQRSNVSHVLNGRNNPSFPFIEKLLKKYPKLNAKWLLTGEGSMMEEKPVLNPSLFDNSMDIALDKPEKELVKPKEQKQAEKLTATSQDNTSIQQNLLNHSENKKVEKIMVLYSDQTFKVYYPEK